MKIKLNLLSLLFVFVVFACSSGHACNYIPTIADGRVSQPTFVNNAAGTDIDYYFPVSAGHSYSVEVLLDRENFGKAGNLAVTVNDGFAVPCAAVDMAGLRDTTGIDPALNGALRRVSFTATPALAADYAGVHISDSTAGGDVFTISVSETTLFSPGWTSTAPYITSYTLGNTTSAVIHGTLSLLNASGVAVVSSNVTLPAGGAALCYTSLGSPVNCPLLNPPAGGAGSAIFAYDGPPGSVQGAAFVQNFTFSPPYSEPLEFKMIRGSASH